MGSTLMSRPQPCNGDDDYGRARYSSQLMSPYRGHGLIFRCRVFELARVMGTSVEMIERHYGALLDGSGASMASRLAVFEAEQDRAGDRARTEAE
jgi:hypothetical protein